MEFALSMSSNFHSSPDYWLDLTLIEIAEWAMVASRMQAREKQKKNFQRLGPGL